MAGPSIDILSKFDDRGVRQAERGLHRMRRSSTSTGATIGRMGASGVRTLGRITRAATIAAGAMAGVGLAIGTKKLLEDERAMRQTERRIQATGKAAGVTAKHVERLANSVESYSGISNSTVQSGANLILTFKNIRNEGEGANAIFDRTTKLAVDMGQVFAETSGTTLDLRSSSTLLAKALNDPIRGLTSLRRVGADLGTETENQVRALAEQGKVMEAQKIILAELETQYGGAAEAFGDSTAGQIAKTRREFEALSAETMRFMLPALRGFSAMMREDLIPAIRRTSQWLERELAPHLTKVAAWWRENGPEIKRQARETFDTVVRVVRETWKWIDANLLPTIVALGKRAAETFRAMINFARDLEPLLTGIGKTFRELIEAALALLRGDFKEFGRNMGQAWTEGFASVIKGIPEAVGNMVRRGDFSGLADLTSLSNPGSAVGRIVGRNLGERWFGQGGGSIPGSGSGDTVPAMLEPGEFVVNRKAVAAVGRGNLERLNRRVPRFQRGGSVTSEAASFARAQVGEPYVWGGGHELRGPGDRRGWDCSGFASQVAMRVPGYNQGMGTTMSLYPGTTPASGGEPVVFGFRGRGNGARGEHMGIRVNGVWYDAGSGGVQVGDSRWDELRVPGGLQYLATGAGPDPDSAGPGYVTGLANSSSGPSMAQLRRQKTALVQRAKSLATGAVSLGRSITDRLGDSISARHRDDSLQDKRVRAHVEGALAKAGVTNSEKVRAVAEASVLKTRRREVQADARDVKSAAAKVRAGIRKVRARRKKLYRELRKTSARRQERLRALYDAIARSRDDERALVFELRGLIAQAADLQAEAAELDFDIGQLAQEISALPNVEAADESASAGTTVDPNQQAALAQAEERARVADRRANLAAGFLRTIGTSSEIGTGATSSLVINVNGSLVHQGELAQFITAALGNQGARPATSQAVA